MKKLVTLLLLSAALVGCAAHPVYVETVSEPVIVDTVPEMRIEFGRVRSVFPYTESEMILVPECRHEKVVGRYEYIRVCEEIYTRRMVIKGYRVNLELGGNRYRSVIMTTKPTVGALIQVQTP
jgi:hypothetical protein